MSHEPVYVGLDVAKAVLDVALRPSDERWSLPAADTQCTRSR